jgi:hypothetical protein
MAPGSQNMRDETGSFLQPLLPSDIWCPWGGGPVVSAPGDTTWRQTVCYTVVCVVNRLLNLRTGHEARHFLSVACML